MKFFLSSVLAFFFIAQFVLAQSLSNNRSRNIVFAADTLLLDTVSIIPASLRIFDNNVPLDSGCYHVLFSESKVVINKSCKLNFGDTLMIAYKVFPLLFSGEYKNRDLKTVQNKYGGQYNPFQYKENESAATNDIFNFEGLTKSGSISRGISFGNNQDVIVNSSLNLQLSGVLSDKVEILAAITDNNIPVQPEGNTQQIQEFDKVFVQLSRDSNKLIAGDFELSRPKSYFMNFFKKAQGGIFSSSFTVDEKKNWLNRVAVSGAIAKGKFSRNAFAGVESNQGPYRLTGAENEQFIIVLSGSERVYINGQLLTRGQENDYVIDYNTAQITFSARRLITKDSRIVVEFQYSDKNYVRTLFYLNDEIENKNFKFRFNYITEQDNKNQPLFQELNADKKNILAGAGDNIQSALAENADSVAFSTSEVLYEKDTVTVNGIDYVVYVYSTDSTRAYYRLGFSNVGKGNGNYNLINSNANGKVYEWIAPVNGIAQGEYEPVSLLISPKRQQLLTFGGDYTIRKNTAITFETAYSKNDINMFSKKDKGNDEGFAFSASIQNTIPLQVNDTGWKIVSGATYEYVNSTFKPIENYRPVEFVRDWNLSAIKTASDENIFSVKTGLVKNEKRNINYIVKSFLKGNEYKGWLNGIGANYFIKGFNINYNGNYLATTGKAGKTNFVRSNADFSKKIKQIIIGYNNENERNKICDALNNELTASSFGHDKGSLYVNVGDTGKFSFKSELFRRYDYGAKENTFFLSSTADQASGDITYQPSAKAKITVGSTYRDLKINSESITTQKNDESFINKLEMGFAFLKGGVTTNTYYEIGTGQEPKQAYSFLKVTAGTGVYEWNDYNANGIEELNEFEVASFSDKAEYIRVFTPTNEFIKTQSNQLSEVLSINPAAFIRNKNKTRLINKFALQATARFANKLLEKKILASANPFNNSVSDSGLVTTNSSYRSTLFFNRSSSVFATDITYEDNRNKNLLANGAESRFQNGFNIIVRTNIKRTWGVNIDGKSGKKENLSSFINRNYKILFNEVQPKLNIQPGTVFRTTVFYKGQIKENVLEGSSEKAEINTVGAEIKYSSITNGVMGASLSLITIGYNAEINSPVAFEMLEGLKRGKNITWEMNVQRNLSNSLLLNIIYNGRKPQGDKVVHTASVQVRAVF